MAGADLYSSVFNSLAGAGANFLGAQAGGRAISSAAQDANQVRLNFYNQANGIYDPFLATGRNALSGIEALTTPGQSANYLSSMPGYQFLLDQGTKIAQSGYAAQGLGSSGEAMKGGTRFAEGLAGTSLAQQFDMLMKQAGIGQDAAAHMSANAMATGAGIGENLMTSGKGWAGADMASGNAFAQGANNATSANMQWSLIDKLLKQGSGSNGADAGTSAISNPNILNAAYSYFQFPGMK